MQRKYYSLSEAAEQSGHSERDLIHFGAVGQLNIYMLQQALTPQLIFEYDDSTNQILTKRPSEPCDAPYFQREPLDEPQLIMEHSLKEFERNPESAPALFDWNAAVHIKDQILRWYSPYIGCTLKPSLMVIMADDLGLLGTSEAPRAHPESIHNRSASPKPKEATKIGLTKHDIALAFQGIKWDYDHWARNLGDAQTQWIKDARATRGRPGKGGHATWNPVLIAVHLQDTDGISVLDLNRIFRNTPSLSDWTEDWIDTQNPFHEN